MDDQQHALAGAAANRPDRRGANAEPRSDAATTLPRDGCGRPCSCSRSTPPAPRSACLAPGARGGRCRRGGARRRDRRSRRVRRRGAGGPLLEALDVSEPSFRIAAGIVAAWPAPPTCSGDHPRPNPRFPAGAPRSSRSPIPVVARPALLVLALGAGADRAASERRRDGDRHSAAHRSGGGLARPRVRGAASSAGRPGCWPRRSSPAASSSPSTGSWRLGPRPSPAHSSCGSGDDDRPAHNRQASVAAAPPGCDRPRRHVLAARCGRPLRAPKPAASDACFRPGKAGVRMSAPGARACVHGGRLARFERRSQPREGRDQVAWRVRSSLARSWPRSLAPPRRSRTTDGRPLSTTLSGAEECSNLGVCGVGDPDGTGTAALRINPGQGEVCFTITVANIGAAGTTTSGRTSMRRLPAPTAPSSCRSPSRPGRCPRAQIFATVIVKQTSPWPGLIRSAAVPVHSGSPTRAGTRRGCCTPPRPDNVVLSGRPRSSANAGAASATAATTALTMTARATQPGREPFVLRGVSQSERRRAAMDGRRAPPAQTCGRPLSPDGSRRRTRPSFGARSGRPQRAEGTVSAPDDRSRAERPLRWPADWAPVGRRRPLPQELCAGLRCGPRRPGSRRRRAGPRRRRARRRAGGRATGGRGPRALDRPAATAVRSATPIAIAPTLASTPLSAPAPSASTRRAGLATSGTATGTSAARRPASAGSGRVVDGTGRRRRRPRPRRRRRCGTRALTSSASSSASPATAARTRRSAPSAPPIGRADRPRRPPACAAHRTRPAPG